MANINPQALKLNHLNHQQEGTITLNTEINFDAYDESDPNQSDDDIELNPNQNIDDSSSSEDEDADKNYEEFKYDMG